MRQSMRMRLAVTGLAAVLLAAVAARAQMKPLRARPDFQRATTKVQVPPKDVRRQEYQLLTTWHKLARPLDPQRVLVNFPVTKLDYSDGVTFQRNQDGWGGCFHYAALHVMDILNEWHAPYTPDLSFRFLEYQGTVEFRQNEDRAQERAVALYGVCSEATCHTNYDTSKLVGTGKDADGDGVEDKTWDHVLFQGATPIPTAANFAEAKRYRAQISPPYKPTVATMKTLLCEYGPIWLSGRFHYTLGLGLGDGHVVAVVGFDDDQEAFKCLNSWGTGRPKDGYFALKYTDVERVWHTQDDEGRPVDANELWDVRTIVTHVDDRSTGPQAYSARVYMESSARNQLTIKVGVAGREPLVAWDMPNREHPDDWSGDLILDMPLPDYAEQYWPPKDGPTPWFVEVSDGVAGKGASVIKAVTLARRYRNPHCKSIGARQTETFEMPGTMMVYDTKTTTVYIPSAPQAGQTAAPTTTPTKPVFRKRPTFQLRANEIKPATPTAPARTFRPKLRDVAALASGLDVNIATDNPSVHWGETFTLTARLVASGAQRVNLGGREVTFYHAHAPKLAYRNRPEEYSFVGKATTGPDGVARLTLKSAFTARAFAAALLDADGEPEASSAKLTIGQVVK